MRNAIGYVREDFHATLSEQGSGIWVFTWAPKPGTRSVALPQGPMGLIGSRVQVPGSPRRLWGTSPSAFAQGSPGGAEVIPSPLISGCGAGVTTITQKTVLWLLPQLLVDGVQYAMQKFPQPQSKLPTGGWTGRSQTSSQ